MYIFLESTELYTYACIVLYYDQIIPKVKKAPKYLLTSFFLDLFVGAVIIMCYCTSIMLNWFINMFTINLLTTTLSVCVVLSCFPMFVQLNSDVAAMVLEAVSGATPS